MKYAFVLLMMLSLAQVVRADDQTQAVQQALKDQGFYYGNVDGQGGSETDAAIRRFQIRQGLEVTGKLNAETLAALNLGGDGGKNTAQADSTPKTSEAAPAAQPPQASQDEETKPPQDDVAQSDRDFLRIHPQTPPSSASGDDSTAQPAQQLPPPPPPAPAARIASGAYSDFFRKTPYESAPAVVQRSTVQRAQQRLAREGFYRGLPDGQLSEALSRAIVAYQRDADMAGTGRLDMATLSDMGLLPNRHVIIRPPAPYYPGPDNGPTIYRGIWVR